jgi:hypothetical protein
MAAAIRRNEVEAQARPDGGLLRLLLQARLLENWMRLQLLEARGALGSCAERLGALLNAVPVGGAPLPRHRWLTPALHSLAGSRTALRKANLSLMEFRNWNPKALD